LNSYRSLVSKLAMMRAVTGLFAFALVAGTLHAAPQGAQLEANPTPTVPPQAADAGKGVVHQLNSAFTKVFELVAPSVVIIEVTKKNDSDNATLDDLLFQNQPDARRNPRGVEPVQSEGSGFIVARMATFIRITTSSRARNGSM
jgi:S1-C subfamily serine protease